MADHKSIIRQRLDRDFDRMVLEQMTTSTVADANSSDNVLTSEKLLTVLEGLPRNPQDPLNGARVLRCRQESVQEARRVADAYGRSWHSIGFEFNGIQIVPSSIVPEGYIVGVKPGRFGEMDKVVLIIGPGKRVAGNE